MLLLQRGANPYQRGSNGTPLDVIQEPKLHALMEDLIHQHCSKWTRARTSHMCVRVSPFMNIMVFSLSVLFMLLSNHMNICSPTYMRLQ